MMKSLLNIVKNFLKGRKNENSNNTYGVNVNVLHKVHFTLWQQEIIELRADNKRLAEQVDDQIKQFRNKGVM